ncbi:MAG: phosphoribosyltransferase family protein [Sulfurimonas sp.]|nr:phosphoribosyltransferase family protein [Sulfurimonas sp.]
MKCLLCENLSVFHICKSCQQTFLTPTLTKRKLLPNIEVLSFYKYSEIKDLLHTKHSDLGFYIYSILATNALKEFATAFTFANPVAAIAIDDLPQSGYSHTAILSKTLKSSSIKPLYNKLRAKNRVSYAGKSKEFRLLNPRNFELQDFKFKEVILVDDIITTGSTLTQAVQALQTQGKEVLFCITLADAAL